MYSIVKRTVRVHSTTISTRSAAAWIRGTLSSETMTMLKPIATSSAMSNARPDRVSASKMTR